MAKVDYKQASGGDASLTINLSVGSAANRYVLAQGFSNASGVLNNVTIGGVAATLLAVDTNQNGNQFALYGASVPGVGSVGVVGNWASIGGIKLFQAVSYDGVTGVRGVALTAKTPALTQPSLTFTTVAGDLVVMLGNDGYFGYTFAPNLPAVLLTVGAFNAGNGLHFGCEETATGASTTIDGLMSAFCPWGVAGVALIQSGGTAPPPPTGSTITTAQLKNNSRFIYANISGCTLLIYHPTTHLLVQAVPGLTTNASGRIVTFVNNLTPANYFYDVIIPPGERRLISAVSV